MQVRAQARTLLREPLVHFLLAGLAVFAFSAWRGEPVDPASRTIEIDEAQVSQLAERFVQSLQRAPSPAELDGLIRDHIKEEVYYREALRLGLEADDAIIRRRLRAKMEYLARSQTETTQTDDAILQSWLDKNPARYAVGARYSLDQIFLGSGQYEGAATRAALAAGQSWQKLGQPISLPRSLEGADSDEIAKIFGATFADRLTKIEPGDAWIGPLPSGFGQHLVRLRAKTKGRTPPLSQVRQRAENDWRAETATMREAQAYQALLDGYTIQIARP